MCSSKMKDQSIHPCLLLKWKIHPPPHTPHIGLTITGFYSNEIALFIIILSSCLKWQINPSIHVLFENERSIHPPPHTPYIGWTIFIKGYIAAELHFYNVFLGKCQINPSIHIFFKNERSIHLTPLTPYILHRLNYLYKGLYSIWITLHVFLS